MKLFTILTLIFTTFTIILAENEPVKLSLYYETLCPDTQAFVLEQLVPVYDSNLKPYINLELVPFGNAKINYPDGPTKSPVVECQHKEPECYGNRLQACFIQIYSPGVSTSLDYVKCMFEKDNWRLTNETAPQCATELGLNWNQIKQCSDSQIGEDLILKFGNQTLGLMPKIDWIPWITVDDIHTDVMRTEALYGLKEYLCTYHFNNQTLDACKSGSGRLSGSFGILVLVLALLVCKI